METKITENLMDNAAVTNALQPPGSYALGPGPWFAIPGPHGEPWAIFACEGDKELFEAAAGLLAAAKAMYALIVERQHYITPNLGSERPEFETLAGCASVESLRFWNAAIAKAEGGVGE